MAAGSSRRRRRIFARLAKIGADAIRQASPFRRRAKMKLVFPNGEHGQVLLSPGVNRIGSDPRGRRGAGRPGSAGALRHPRHQQRRQPAGAAGAGPVAVNGKPVADIMGLRSGDLLVDRPGARPRSLVVEEARSAVGRRPGPTKTTTPPACAWRCPSSCCAAFPARCSARCSRSPARW